MTFSLIILLALVYFLYSFARSLIELEGGFAAFETVHWILFAMCILFVPLIVLSTIRYIKDNKKQKEQREEEMKKQQEEMHQRRRSKYLIDDEGFDETYSELDKIPPAADEDEDDFDEEDTVYLDEDDVVDIDEEDESEKEPQDKASKKDTDGNTKNSSKSKFDE